MTIKKLNTEQIILQVNDTQLLMSIWNQTT
jgi:hypothetical protein